MNKLSIICFVLFLKMSLGQGPPISIDKPIMIGAERWMLMSKMKFNTLQNGTQASTIPLMVHYLPTANSMVALAVPYKNFDGQSFLGNIRGFYKYQFYRKDEKGKTLRISAKTAHEIPIGTKIEDFRNPNGFYEMYNALVLGIENLKYGVAAEVGWKNGAFTPSNALVTKVGFGKPLLEPKFPLRQINLYLENHLNWYYSKKNSEFIAAPGIQWAHGSMLFELSYQFTVWSDLEIGEQLKNRIQVGIISIL